MAADRGSVGMSIASVNWMLNQLASTKLKLVRLYDDSGVEIVSHSGARQDQDATWLPADGGHISLEASLRFEIPAGVTVARIAFMDDVGFIVWESKDIPVSERETYANNGLFDVTEAHATISIL